MAAIKSADTRALNDLITSTLALLSQFSASLATPTATTRIENPPNPLRVASDAAKLVKAHTTKVSLLAINKPFTPSAICTVLKELSGTCLPAMMSAVQICEQEKSSWTGMMARELQIRVARVLKEMEMLLGEVQSTAAGKQATSRRDSLRSTAVVWESCDALIELEKGGIAGLALQKAQQYQETVKDALSELKEWREGEDTDFEGQGDGLLDSDDEGVDGDKDSLELDIFNAANSMPKDRPELASLVVEAEGKLKKVTILYQALIKRRLKTLDQSPNSEAIAKLDSLMMRLKRIPPQIDDMVGKFYDLDEESAEQALVKVMTEAKNACQGVSTDWSGEEDQFTPWLSQWTTAVR